MSQEAIAGSRASAWLLSRSGPLLGTRFPLLEGDTRVGRAPDNDVVVDGADCSTVSLYHVLICKGAGPCQVRDLGSTNGTWVNGERITETVISAPAIIQLGSQGPEFALVLADAAPADLNRTIEVPSPVPPQTPHAAASHASAWCAYSSSIPCAASAAVTAGWRSSGSGAVIAARDGSVVR